MSATKNHAANKTEGAALAESARMFRVMPSDDLVIFAERIDRHGRGVRSGHGYRLRRRTG